MNRKQLETFETIVRLGSFAAAAAKLNATQSTVSARIQELEESLCVQLFDRAQRKANLTTKGRELVSYAQTAIDETAGRSAFDEGGPFFCAKQEAGLPRL